MRRQKGQHLQWSDRLIIERMRLNRATTREIAAAIGCSHVTIVKELKRGQYEHTNSDLTTEIRYSPELAERQHRVNMTIKGPEVKIGHDHALARTLEHLIVKEKYSPYAAVARLNLEGWAYNVRVCARTVYNYIYKGGFRYYPKAAAYAGQDEAAHPFRIGRSPEACICGYAD